MKISTSLLCLAVITVGCSPLGPGGEVVPGMISADYPNYQVVDLPSEVASGSEVRTIVRTIGSGCAEPRRVDVTSTGSGVTLAPFDFVSDGDCLSTANVLEHEVTFNVGGPGLFSVNVSGTEFPGTGHPLTLNFTITVR